MLINMFRQLLRKIEQIVSNNPLEMIQRYLPNKKRNPMILILINYPFHVFNLELERTQIVILMVEIASLCQKS